MPTVMLTGSAPANLPILPITIFLETDTPGGGAVEIVVDPAVDVRRPRPGMLVLPRVDRAVTIAARPAHGTTFTTPTVVHLTAMVTSPGVDDPERVVIPGVTVSGLPSMDLLHLSPASGQVSLSRPTVTESLVLSELGHAAMIATRAALGRSRVPEMTRVDVGILVDGSASMSTAMRSGALTHAIDVITGVVPVIGRSERGAVQVALGTMRKIEADPAHQALAVTEVLGNAALTTGFVAQGPSDSSSELTFIVTDGLPVDHDHLDRHMHVVVLADLDSEPGLRAMTSAAFTVLPTGTNHGRSQLLDDAAALDRVVRSLTADWSTTSSGAI